MSKLCKHGNKIKSTAPPLYRINNPDGTISLSGCYKCLRNIAIDKAEKSGKITKEKAEELRNKIKKV